MAIMIRISAMRNVNVSILFPTPQKPSVLAPHYFLMAFALEYFHFCEYFLSEGCKEEHNYAKPDKLRILVESQINNNKRKKHSKLYAPQNALRPGEEPYEYEENKRNPDMLKQALQYYYFPTL